MEEEKVRLQHYVPRVYLKNFSEGSKKGYYIWVFDKKTEKIFQENIKNIALEEEFYDTIEEKQITENFLRDIETNFGNAINNLIDGQDLEKLGQDEIEAITEFIAAQMIRTKEVRAEVKDAAKQFLGKFGSQLATNFKTEVEESMKKENLREGHKKIIFEHLETFKQIIKGKKWILISNKSKFPYWISDNPIAECNRYGDAGLDALGVEIYFPISTKLCLIICDPVAFRLEGNKKVTKDYRNIIRERDLQVRYSTRFVFSNEKNFDFARTMLKENPSLSDPNRKRVKIN
ncbi:MAG: DUF4238 domain-containing protein [archaeon]|nr:DUF4238 domain-containing protein [archaeon]